MKNTILIILLSISTSVIGSELDKVNNHKPIVIDSINEVTTHNMYTIDYNIIQRALLEAKLDQVLENVN